MTPEEKIAELVAHIKKEFPKGCKHIECSSNCPLYNALDETVEHAICKMLYAAY